MVVALIVGIVVYLAAGFVTYLVTVLRAQGRSGSAYIDSLFAWGQSNVVAEGVMALGLVLLWPLHLVLAKVLP